MSEQQGEDSGDGAGSSAPASAPPSGPLDLGELDADQFVGIAPAGDDRPGEFLSRDQSASDGAEQPPTQEDA